ncbi:hypothetical protein NKDENANG_03017 [Candidatus Entotheonellaceae bacterium PAL068K]
MADLKAHSCVGPNRIGIVSFCFGGRVSYQAAAVFYGGRILHPFEPRAHINVPILGLFGEDDQNPWPADVATTEAELQRQVKAYAFRLYPGCGHGFYCNSRAS